MRPKMSANKFSERIQKSTLFNGYLFPPIHNVGISTKYFCILMLAPFRQKLPENLHYIGGTFFVYIIITADMAPNLH